MGLQGAQKRSGPNLQGDLNVAVEDAVVEEQILEVLEEEEGEIGEGGAKDKGLNPASPNMDHNIQIYIFNIYVIFF